MLSESEQRAVQLALAAQRAEPARVQELVRAFLAAKQKGIAPDLFEVFQRENVLTQADIERLEPNLEKTQLAIQVEKREANIETLPDADPSARTEEHPALPTTGPPSPALPEPKQIGDYRLLRRLGEGGMGSVYLAFDPKTNRQVAIKVLSPQHAALPGVLNRFQREGQSGALLNHPHIVRSYDTGYDDATGLHFLVLEYIDGPSAHDLLERLDKLAVGDAVRIILDTARALAHAHDCNIIHRDIKPGNILLTAAGEAKLSDLGLVRKTDETSHLTQARQGVGTPFYVPYEQALNAKRADARSDIFALGATFYHLLTGELPFPGENSVEVVERKAIGVYRPARALNPDVPPAIETILSRMLSRNPDDRYQTARDLIADLERTGLASTNLNIQGIAPPSRPSSRPSSPMRATSPDLRSAPTPEDPTPEDTAPKWYLRFRDGRNNLCEVIVPLGEIVKRLYQGRLSLDDAEASRTPGEGFKRLAEVPEVRTALRRLIARQADPEEEVPEAPAPHSSTNPIVLSVLILALLAALVLLAYFSLD